MKYSFEYYDPARAELGGVLTIVATNRKDAQEILGIRHFRPEIDQTIAMVDLLNQTGEYAESFGDEKRPCFPVEVTIDWKWISPYIDALQSLVGKFELPDRLDLVKFPQPHHTVFVEKAYIDTTGLVCGCYDTAEDWNGRRAHANAIYNANRSVLDLVSRYNGRPEFIPANEMGTLYRRNPDWGTGANPRRPYPESTDLWEDLCDWWRDNVASPAQLAILEQEAREDIVRGCHYLKNPGSYSHWIFIQRPEGYMSRDEFISLGRQLTHVD